MKTTPRPKTESSPHAGPSPGRLRPSAGEESEGRAAGQVETTNASPRRLAAQPRRIFIECTATRDNGGNTGIQRVVRNIANSAPRIGEQFGFECQPVAYYCLVGFEAIHRLPPPTVLPKWLCRMYSISRPLWAGEGAIFYRSIVWLKDLPILNAIVRLAQRSQKHAARRLEEIPRFRAALRIVGRAVDLPASVIVRSLDKLKRVSLWKIGVRAHVKLLLASVGLLRPAQRAKAELRKFLNVVSAPIRSVSWRRVRFGPGDVLVLLDAGWTAQYWDDVRKARRRGVLVGVVVYDLIPMQHPNCLGEHARQSFHAWWKQASAVCDFVVCISESVWHDVQARGLTPRGGSRSSKPLVGGSFRLGAELDVCIQPGKIRPQLVRILRGPPSPNAYLMVGMLSPRKNHAFVLDAFDRLWDQGVEASLVIVGKFGWDAETLVRRIQAHPQYNQRLFWFDDVGDVELDYCYRHAAALITASYAEGFNLPIVESLHRETPVFASDLPVHREVGGEFAAYFPLDDAGALARLVEQHQQQGLPAGVKSPEDFQWPDWTESCRELLQRVVELGAEATRKTREEDGPSIRKRPVPHAA